MGSKRRLRVLFVDGREPVVVNISPRVQVTMERHFGTSLINLDHAEHAYYAAWVALGKQPPDFDEFLDTIDDVEKVDEQSENPTSVGP
jgi:hypothetical protein